MTGEVLDAQTMRMYQAQGLKIDHASMLWVFLPSGPSLTTNTDAHRLWAEEKGYNSCPAFTTADIVRLIPETVPGDKGMDLDLFLEISVTWKNRYWTSRYTKGRNSEQRCVINARSFPALLHAMLRWFIASGLVDLLKNPKRVTVQ